MVKRICDRCGKNVKTEKIFYFYGDSILNNRYVLHETHYSNTVSVDLCEECNKKFQSLIGKFMNGVWTMIKCTSFEAKNRFVIVDFLRKMSNEYFVIDYNIIYDSERKHFVLVVRYQDVSKWLFF